MLTFTQHQRALREHFFGSTRGKFGYCEIFKNPSLAEYLDAGERMDASIHMREHGGKQVYTAGIATSRDLFVWDRETGEHLEVAAAIVPPLPPNWLPLYLYYYPLSETLGVSLSKFSIEGRLSYAPAWPRLLSILQANPAFRIFKHIVEY